MTGAQLLGVLAGMPAHTLKLPVCVISGGQFRPVAAVIACESDPFGDPDMILICLHSGSMGEAYGLAVAPTPAAEVG